MDDQDPITQKALFRFQVISAYLAADPPRGIDALNGMFITSRIIFWSLNMLQRPKMQLIPLAG